MSCCNSEFVCEAPRDEADVFNDKTVSVYIEYGSECHCCGDRSREGSVSLDGKFKHGCQKRRKLSDDEPHFSISKVGEPRLLSKSWEKERFSVDVSIHCEGCYETFEVKLEGDEDSSHCTIP